MSEMKVEGMVQNNNHLKCLTPAGLGDPLQTINENVKCFYWDSQTG